MICHQIDTFRVGLLVSFSLCFSAWNRSEWCTFLEINFVAYVFLSQWIKPNNHLCIKFLAYALNPERDGVEVIACRAHKTYLSTVITLAFKRDNMISLCKMTFKLKRRRKTHTQREIRSRPVSISGPVSLSQLWAAHTDYTLVVPYLAPITIDYGHVIIGNTIYKSISWVAVVVVVVIVVFVMMRKWNKWASNVTSQRPFLQLSLFATQSAYYISLWKCIFLSGILILIFVCSSIPLFHCFSISCLFYIHQRIHTHMTFNPVNNFIDQYPCLRIKNYG